MPGLLQGIDKPFHGQALFTLALPLCELKPVCTVCQEDRHSDVVPFPVQHSVGIGPEQNIQHSVSVSVRMQEGTPDYPRGGEVPGDMVLRRSRVHRSSNQNIKGLDGGKVHQTSRSEPRMGWS